MQQRFCEHSSVIWGQPLFLNRTARQISDPTVTESKIVSQAVPFIDFFILKISAIPLKRDLRPS